MVIRMMSARDIYDTRGRAESQAEKCRPLTPRAGFPLAASAICSAERSERTTLTAVAAAIGATGWKPCECHSCAAATRAFAGNPIGLAGPRIGDRGRRFHNAVALAASLVGLAFDSACKL